MTDCELGVDALFLNLMSCGLENATVWLLVWKV